MKRHFIIYSIFIALTCIAPAASLNLALHKKATASTFQGGSGPEKAFDGDENTRWCASGGEFPQTLTVDLGQPQKLGGLRIHWEQQEASFKYQLEGSPDNVKWTPLADASNNNKPGDHGFVSHEIKGEGIRFVRLNVLGASGGWASLYEMELFAEAPPKIVAETDPVATEKKILTDVKAPKGYDVTVFASPPMANYPVFITASPDGTVFVSSDKNGSLGRDLHHGRILRLRDTKGTGHADEMKEFVPDVDSPRGLVWDFDRAYCVHPPNLSAFIDHHGTGVADEEKVLIKGIAFGFKDRPADHTTNGLTMGIDGWLYIAGGDFGFMEAEGTDGRKLQHRGGGVIRLQPDGSGLELYSKGTRNILQVAIDPLMNMFARDNTNDGDGWDTRYHHFTGLEYHGYPSFYQHFADEAITPLADYGGGGAVGGTYVDEPGFPNNDGHMLYSLDWGRSWCYQHPLKAKGATFDIEQKEFLGMTRTTTMCVDSLSHMYAASWKGATFNYAGEDVGYIVRLNPIGKKPQPLPDLEKMDDAGLVKQLEGESHTFRMAAQRTLLRRGLKPEIVKALNVLAGDSSKKIESRVAAIYALRIGLGIKAQDLLIALMKKDDVREFALRALTNGVNDNADVPAAPLLAALKDANPRVRIQAVIATARRGKTDIAMQVADVLGDSDPVIAHTAYRVLAQLKAVDALFAVVDKTDAPYEQRTHALWSLHMQHDPAVTDGLLQRLANEKDSARRQGLLGALCRLYLQDGKWEGNSWGTRPDTSGPYYQGEQWSESPKILAALKADLGKAAPDEAAFLINEMSRNKVQSDDTLNAVLALAAKDAKVLPAAVGQLAHADSVPAAGIPLLLQAVQMTDAKPEMIAQAIIALSKTDSAEGCRASLSAFHALKHAPGSGKFFESARSAFLSAPKLENHHQLLEEEAATKLGKPAGLWADAALLTLSTRKTGAPEPRELSAKALDTGWQNPRRREQIIRAVGELKHNAYTDKVLASLTDPDKGVAAAAKEVVGKMKLEKKGKDSGPLIGTMKKEDIIALVVKTKGDAALGEQLFTRQTCVACHTTSQDQPQKGPYLGNIAQTYKRPDLAENILDPNKTIAQGFTTNVFTLKDGSMNMGFVTTESGDKVTMRNIAAQEFTYETKNIVKRETLPTSMMPVGLVNNLTVKEFASLLDYLESLAKK